MVVSHNPRARSLPAKRSLNSGQKCALDRWTADQARTDFAAIESDLEVIQIQLSRLPRRRELAGTALGIIFATAALVILWAEAFWHL